MLVLLFLVMLSSLLLLVVGFNDIAVAGILAWQFLVSNVITVAGLPAIAGVPGVVGVLAVALVTAAAGVPLLLVFLLLLAFLVLLVPADYGVPILVGVFTYVLYCTMRHIRLSDYGCWTCLSCYRTIRTSNIKQVN
jgi:hypothetical protein